MQNSRQQLSDDDKENVPPAKAALTSAKHIQLTTTSTSHHCGPALLISRATPQQVAAFVDVLAGLHTPALPPCNQSLPPRVRTLTNHHLAFPHTVPNLHCMYLVTRTSSKSSQVFEQIKLRERGRNNDAPRTNLLDGTARKVIISHTHSLCSHCLDFHLPHFSHAQSLYSSICHTQSLPDGTRQQR